MKARKRQASGKVVIDGVALVWELVREAHYSSSDGYKGMQFSVRAVSDTARTLRELVLEFPFPKRKPGFHQDKERILPPRIEAAIHEAIAAGWDPVSRGRVWAYQVEGPAI
jgi:hypothetical protein